MDLLRCTVAVTVLAIAVLAATWGRGPAAVVLVVVGALLAGSVLAAVHHRSAPRWRASG